MKLLSTFSIFFNDFSAHKFILVMASNIPISFIFQPFFLVKTFSVSLVLLINFACSMKICLLPFFLFVNVYCSLLCRTWKQAPMELGAAPPYYVLHWWEPLSIKCWLRWERPKKLVLMLLRSDLTVWEPSILAQILNFSSNALLCQLLSLTGLI